MKRIVAMLLTAALLCGILASCAPAPAVTPDAPAETAQPTEPAPTEAPETAGLPSVDDEVSGFVVKELIPMDVLGATGVVFEHVKSGATLLYLASEDINRSFDITFRTPALDEKGKPHVFEHMTICGSEKYPDANLFFPFANQTYSTFVNAVTYSGMTSYPVASLSEEQLMCMMDYYLSGVFTPLLYSEPRLVQREAWRYELTDTEDPIGIAGTVYSEMQGALTLDRRATRDIERTLFKGSPVAHESGGMPEAIRTLTYDELIDFHDAYYHPSNALITLYGKLDYAKVLAFIDAEYLSKYDKKDVYVERGRVEPYTETLYETYEAPVEAGAETEDVSVIYYAFAADGAQLKDVTSLSVLSSLLSQESSLLMQTLREKLPKANVSIGVSFDAPTPYVSFVANGVNEEDRDVFTAAVDESLAKMAAEGVSEDALDSVLAISKLSLMLTPENTDLGVSASLAIAQGWTYYGSLDYYNIYENVVNEMNAASATELIGKYLVNNAYRAVSVTKPAPGKTEEDAAALASELADRKQAMSASEIETMAKDSAEFAQWSAAPVAQEIIDKLIGVEAADLPEELQHFDVRDEDRDGVRYLSAEAQVDDAAIVTLMLDGSTIPVEKLQDVETYLSLLGELDTGTHSKEELSTLITKYLSIFMPGLAAQTGYEGASDLYVANFNWIGLGEYADEAVALVKEMTLDTQLTDIDTIKSVLTRSNTSTRSALESMALYVQLARCGAMLYDTNAYTEYVTDIEMYRHNEELIALAQKDPALLTKRLEEAKALLNNKHDAMVLCAGGSSALAAYMQVLPTFFADMPDEARDKVDYSVLRIPMQNEALVNNSTVQMNVLAGKADGYSGKTDVVNALITDKYMLPQLRNALGAYGAYATGNINSTMLYTYRDPNLEGTYEIFAKLPEYLRTAELTQEDVNNYIIGSYSALSRPLGALSGATAALQNKLLGLSEETRLQWMKDAKATTPEDVRTAAESYEALVQDGVRSTSGAASTLKKAGDLFDVQVTLEEDVRETALQPAA